MWAGSSLRISLRSKRNASTACPARRPKEKDRRRTWAVRRGPFSRATPLGKAIHALQPKADEICRLYDQRWHPIRGEAGSLAPPRHCHRSSSGCRNSSALELASRSFGTCPGCLRFASPSHAATPGPGGRPPDAGNPICCTFLLGRCPRVARRAARRHARAPCQRHAAPCASTGLAGSPAAGSCLGHRHGKVAG